MQTKCLEEYDRYKAIGEPMPYPKGVHAKTHVFDANGNDTGNWFWNMFKITSLLKMYCKDDKYLDNDAGVLATKKMIEKVASVYDKQ